MQPFSPHTRFFSSLTQIENRLKSENGGENPKPSPLFSSDSQLGSPLFLDYSQPCVGGSVKEHSSFSKIQDGSCPSLDSSTSYLKAEDDDEEQEQEKSKDPEPQCDHGEHSELNEIEQLISLLGLSINGVEEGGSNCDCSGGGFYSKVAEIKGPKCNKEKKRLDQWIDCFVTAKREPARLAHLLLAKAAMLQGEEKDEFGRVEFPVAIQEFFEHDPSKKDE